MAPLTTSNPSHLQEHKKDYKDTSFKKNNISNNDTTGDHSLLSDNIFNKNSFSLSAERVNNDKIDKITNKDEEIIAVMSSNKPNANTPIFKQNINSDAIPNEQDSHTIKPQSVKSTSLRGESSSQFNSIHSTISANSQRSNHNTHRPIVKVE